MAGYRGFIVDSMESLFCLDDKPISKEERINYLDFKMYPGSIKAISPNFVSNYLAILNVFVCFQFIAEHVGKEARFSLKVLSLKNLPVPPQPDVKLSINANKITLTMYIYF